MAYGITDYSRVNKQYTQDNGVASQVTIRNVYSVVSGLTTAPNNSGLPFVHPKHCRRRYIYSPNGGTQNHPVERHYPINIPAGLTAPVAVAGVNIDGVTTFALKGFVGEHRRAGVGF